MSKPVLYMLVGVPCAGKSTWVQWQMEDEKNYYVASTDRLLEIYASMRGATYNDVFKEHIGYAEKAMMTHIKDAVMYGYDIVWDQTNLTRKSRAKKLAMIPDHYEKIALVFSTPERDELFRRLDSRPGKTIPEHIINNMIDSLEVPTKDEGFDIVMEYAEDLIYV